MSETNETRASTTTAKVADTRDPRDIHRDALEQEIVTLRRQLAEAREESEGHRTARTATLARLRAAEGRVGERIVSALVEAVPAEAEHIVEGARVIDNAAQKALDDAVSRAETAERTKDEAVETVTRLWLLVNALTRERNEERDRAAAAERDRDAARAEVARLTAHLHPKPEPVDLVTLQAQARREAGGVEAPTSEPKRVPPFVWSEAGRAKLVEGATVVCHWADAGPKRMRVRKLQEGVCNWLVAFMGDGPGEAARLNNCDPTTVEPPTTAKVEERPPCPDLRKGDKVRTTDGRVRQITGAPYNPSGYWLVPCEGGTAFPVDLLDLSTRVRTWKPGEVVPHAPTTVKREIGGLSLADTMVRYPTLPLAEPWTQTGVSP